LKREENAEGKNTLCNIRRIIVIFIIVGILYGTGILQSISQVCEKESMNISCSDVSDCEVYYINMGVPQSWINQQQFLCESGVCYIIPSECDATWIKL